MQATFAMVRRLPPPATGAHILTWLNSTGTWLTTYAWVSAVMQLIIRHTVFLDIIPHLLFRPRDEGIHLDELVHLVPLYNLHILTGNALFTTQATYPYIKTLKGHVEKLNTQVAELQEETKQQEEALVTQSNMMNEAYVCIGSKKELKEAGLLSGGTLFKKSKLDLSQVNASAFQKIDIRHSKTFKIPGKKVSILTQMPAGSYTITDNGDGTSTLTITDVTRFWSVSNYLVVRY